MGVERGEGASRASVAPVQRPVIGPAKRLWAPLSQLGAGSASRFRIRTRL